MSLTVCIGKKSPEVVIVRSFREPKYPNSYIEYHSGPIIQLSFDEFRSKGAGLVKEHFAAYESVRITEKDAIPVFTKDEARRLLKNRNVVGIFFDYFNTEGGFRLVAFRFKSYSLSGLVDLGMDYHRCLQRNCSQPEFWSCFDAVLENSS